MNYAQPTMITFINLTLPSLQEPKKVLSWLLAEIPDWFDISDETAVLPYIPSS